jgi:hypothetical protein
MQSPKLTLKNLKDPSGLDPKIRALIKKLLKLIKENKNKTLNELSLYPSLSAWERDMLLKNYALLLESLSSDMKKTQTDYFGWALLFAWFHYRQKVVVSMIPVFSPSGEPVFKKPDILPEYPNVGPELTKMFDERTSNLFNDVRQELQDGIKMDLDNAHINNWTSKKVQEKINERYNRAEKRSIMIARTEIQFVYNTFIVEQAKKDGYESLIWVTQADEMVCSVCGPNHLKRFPISNLPIIPAHPNCFLPGTRYESPSKLVCGIRTMYNGEAVELLVSPENRITVTPNHLFLTPNGFAAAKLLRKGDQVINTSGTERIVTSDINNNQMPSRVEDVFDTLCMSSDMAIRSVPSSPEYLHSDARFVDGNIDIVFPKSFLGGACESPFLDHLNGVGFGGINECGIPLLGQSSLNKFLVGACNATIGGVCSIRESDAFFRSRLTHSEGHGFGTVSLSDSDTPQSINDGGSTDVKLLSELLNAHSGIVEINDILDINIVPYHGWVYDFQTINSLCIGNSFVTSNCRCVWELEH